MENVGRRSERRDEWQPRTTIDAMSSLCTHGRVLGSVTHRLATVGPFSGTIARCYPWGLQQVQKKVHGAARMMLGGHRAGGRAGSTPSVYLRHARGIGTGRQVSDAARKSVVKGVKSRESKNEGATKGWTVDGLPVEVQQHGDGGALSTDRVYIIAPQGMNVCPVDESVVNDGMVTGDGRRRIVLDIIPSKQCDGSNVPQASGTSDIGAPGRVAPTNDAVTVYTDGSCFGNGKDSVAGAGVGVFYAQGAAPNVSVPLERSYQPAPGVAEAVEALGGGRLHVTQGPTKFMTNIRAETMAMLMVLEQVVVDARLRMQQSATRSGGPYSRPSCSPRSWTIWCDCRTVILTMQDWSKGWVLRDGVYYKGREAKANSDLLIPLLKLYNVAMETACVDLKIHHIKGHAGHAGNEAANDLAQRASAAMAAR